MRRVNQLESESLELEGRTHRVERENRSLTRELDRLRQAIEVKDLSLDNSSARMTQVRPCKWYHNSVKTIFMDGFFQPTNSRGAARDIGGWWLRCIWYRSDGGD